jgi:PAS domain-containing protein
MLLATLRLEGSRAAVGDYLRLYQKNWNHALVVKAVEEIPQHKRLARKILLVGIFHRCRYLRQELLGRTVHELRMWEDPADRQFLPAQLQRGGPIRNVITRLRTKSGEIKLTAYSASKIQFDGQPGILTVSDDVPQIRSPMRAIDFPVLK